MSLLFRNNLTVWDVILTTNAKEVNEVQTSMKLLIAFML